MRLETNDFYQVFNKGEFIKGYDDIREAMKVMNNIGEGSYIMNTEQPNTVDMFYGDYLDYSSFTVNTIHLKKEKDYLIAR